MNSFKENLKFDICRFTGERKFSFRFVYLFFLDIRFRQIFLFRLLSNKNLFFKIFSLPLKLYYRKLKYKSGIQLSIGTKVGGGLLFEHWGSIIISPLVVIGSNCTIAQNVTLGLKKTGLKTGAPIIGNNVFIGPGAVVLGNIKVGNNAAIGANSVVLHDVPENTTVAGAPAVIISRKGSYGYI